MQSLHLFPVYIPAKSIILLLNWVFPSKIHLFARVFLPILLVLAFFALFRFFSRRVKYTEEYVIIQGTTIPWSTIDHITLKKSVLQNQYIAVYFKDDTLPKGFDIEFIDKKEEFIQYLKDHADVRVE